MESHEGSIRGLGMRAARRLSIRLAEPAPGRAGGPGLGKVHTRCGRSNPGFVRLATPNEHGYGRGSSDWGGYVTSPAQK